MNDLLTREELPGQNTAWKKPSMRTRAMISVRRLDKIEHRGARRANWNVFSPTNLRQMGEDGKDRKPQEGFEGEHNALKP